MPTEPSPAALQLAEKIAQLGSLYPVSSELVKQVAMQIDSFPPLADLVNASITSTTLLRPEPRQKLAVFIAPWLAGRGEEQCTK